MRDHKAVIEARERVRRLRSELSGAEHALREVQLSALTDRQREALRLARSIAPTLEAGPNYTSGSRGTDHEWEDAAVKYFTIGLIPNELQGDEQRAFEALVWRCFQVVAQLVPETNS